MKYSKKPLTFEQQADLLLKRGLLADKSCLIKTLSSIDYYRLSGYLRPQQAAKTDAHEENTNLNDVIKGCFLGWLRSCFFSGSIN